MLSAETTLGRAPGCGVRIDDVRVSKLHARLFLHEGAWYLEDLGSTNGTQLDGEELVGPTRIKRGARIQITEIELVLT
ncbi:MAG: FHA domain-containing protein [Acidimicrobiaceae bacterium]|nr:FHA domain-containing protein [Acidimicrobiaceae bacterium]